MSLSLASISQVNRFKTHYCQFFGSRWTTVLYCLHKEGFFWEFFFTFPSIFSDWWVVWSWFCYRCKELLLSNLLDTYNMVVGCVEIFLTTLKKSFPEKMGRFGKICHLSKWLQTYFFSWSFLRFLPYFLIDASYDYNFVTVVKNYSWTTF